MGILGKMMTQTVQTPPAVNTLESRNSYMNQALLVEDGKEAEQAGGR